MWFLMGYVSSQEGNYYYDNQNLTKTTLVIGRPRRFQEFNAFLQTLQGIHLSPHVVCTAEKNGDDL